MDKVGADRLESAEQHCRSTGRLHYRTDQSGGSVTLTASAIPPSTSVQRSAGSFVKVELIAAYRSSAGGVMCSLCCGYDEFGNFLHLGHAAATRFQPDSAVIDFSVAASQRLALPDYA
jgi:hypothetical protein